MSAPDAVSALRRSDRAFCEQICESQPLDFGVAYCCTAFPELTEAHQLRDVWLAGVDARTAFQQGETHYHRHGLVCSAWVPAAAQPIEPIEALLLDMGWNRRDRLAMQLINWKLLEVPTDTAVRILPARAMRRAFRQTFAEAGPRPDLLADAALERLNDSNYDVFVATLCGRPAGRIGYLEIGDIASVTDVFVPEEFRRRGVGSALAAYVLRLARRLLPKILVTGAYADDRAAQAFFQKCGFAPAGTITEFHRPPGSRHGSPN